MLRLGSSTARMEANHVMSGHFVVRRFKSIVICQNFYALFSVSLHPLHINCTIHMNSWRIFSFPFHAFDKCARITYPGDVSLRAPVTRRRRRQQQPPPLSRPPFHVSARFGENGRHGANSSFHQVIYGRWMRWSVCFLSIRKQSSLAFVRRVCICLKQMQSAYGKSA